LARVGFNKENVKGFDPVDEGDYTVEVVKATIGTSKTGNPKLSLDMLIEKAPEQDNGQEVEGHHLFCDMSAADDGKAFMLAQALDCFQVPNDAEGFDTDDFIGAKGVVRVKKELYTPSDGEPRTQNKVDKFLA